MTSQRKFSMLSSALTLLSALIIGMPSSARADFTPFTLVSPTNNQKVSLGASNNWYLPIRVNGAGPGSDSNRFTAYFYDSVGDVAASVSWIVTPNVRIDTPVDWTFKLGLSNLNYVENPIASNIYVPTDAKYFAELSATKAPFKNGTLKPGTYSFQLFVTNNSNFNGQSIPLGDVAGLTVGKPAGVKCAPGSFSKTGTWTSSNACTLAAPGYLANTFGLKKQSATPAGSFTPKSGAAFNQKCMEGTYQPKVGKATCPPASLGYFVPNRGATKQVKCPIGKYADRTGTFACTLAQPGTFVPAEGGKTSTTCPVGRFQPFAGKGFCTPAPAGSFVGIQGAIEANRCPSGTYQDKAGASGCKQATRGHFAFGPSEFGSGATFQTECSLGTFASFDGAFVCLGASLGYYVPTTGAEQATQCPVGTITLFERSTRLEDCVPAD